MKAWAFQCIQGLKLIFEILEEYLMIKKRDCLVINKIAFLRQFLCMFGYENLHGKGTNEFGKFWKDFGKSYMWKKEKNQI